MPTLESVLNDRSQKAASRARRAAVMASDDTSSAIDVDLALADLELITRQRADLAAVARELDPYREGRQSILRDLHESSRDDMVATHRLADHRAARPNDREELRSIGSGSIFAQVPRWVFDLLPTDVPSSPLLNLAEPLGQNDGSTYHFPGLSTLSAAMQTAFGGTITPQDWTDTDNSAPICKGVHAQLISTQLLEQSNRNIDRLVIPAQVKAVNAAIDSSILNGAGSSGALTGLNSLSSTQSITYTQASPTAATLTTAVEQAIRAAELHGDGDGHPLVICHPRRLSDLREKSVTATSPTSPIFSAPRRPWATIAVNGIDWVVDLNVATNLGAGTNQDEIFVLAHDGVVRLALGDPVINLSSEPSGTLQNRITCHRPVAFASQLPGAIAKINGTGLVAPS